MSRRELVEPLTSMNILSGLALSVGTAEHVGFPLRFPQPTGDHELCPGYPSNLPNAKDIGKYEFEIVPIRAGACEREPAERDQPGVVETPERVAVAWKERPCTQRGCALMHGEGMPV